MRSNEPKTYANRVTMHKTPKPGRLSQLNLLEEPTPYHKQPSHLEGAV